MNDLEILERMYQKYLDAANKAYKAKNLASAKKNFVLAAKAKFGLAEFSTPSFKEAQILVAKNLVHLADMIDIELEHENELKTKQLELAKALKNKQFTSMADKADSITDDIEGFLAELDKDKH